MYYLGMEIEKQRRQPSKDSCICSVWHRGQDRSVGKGKTIQIGYLYKKIWIPTLNHAQNLIPNGLKS